MRERRGWSKSELARRLNVTPGVVGKWESGEKHPKSARYSDIASALGCDVYYLVQGDDQLEQRKLPVPLSDGFIPVLGYAVAGSDLIALNTADSASFETDKVARPPMLTSAKAAFAIRLRGESMEPRFFPGELLYIDPHRPAIRGRFVLVEFNDGNAAVRQYIETTKDHVVVKTLNPPREVRYKPGEIKHIHRVVGVVEE